MLGKDYDLTEKVCRVTRRLGHNVFIIQIRTLPKRCFCCLKLTTDRNKNVIAGLMHHLPALVQHMKIGPHTLKTMLVNIIQPGITYASTM